VVPSQASICILIPCPLHTTEIYGLQPHPASVDNFQFLCLESCLYDFLHNCFVSQLLFGKVGSITLYCYVVFVAFMPHLFDPWFHYMDKYLFISEQNISSAKGASNMYPVMPISSLIALQDAWIKTPVGSLLLMYFSSVMMWATIYSVCRC